MSRLTVALCCALHCSLLDLCFPSWCYNFGQLDRAAPVVVKVSYESSTQVN
ncbi:hypothetical protein PF010_g3948 [Phytophthora fragariae]|uniref:RxLR effector protein n=2 Tax=Phytophthora TaxID=4783 RepID=A0A6A3UJR7_9STRA|nr:hypothetical protein PF003_g24801 [Phytophthora fragariae]KAE9038274.1 hypothetical protein PR002_g6104 [Phytophthora rubi]KAE8945415.1 hypothetical protein PF009_g4925 [Phytophthora fragariae]KAE9027125.1 hypothetical protein PF011_g2189 [Phytophthora fragariae]KAE9043770.1 hypothetical protein PR001_g5646 [Phytophthora rubi]